MALRKKNQGFMVVELLTALVFVALVFFLLWQAMDQLLEAMVDLDRKEGAYQRVFAGLEVLTAGGQIDDGLELAQQGDLWTLSEGQDPGEVAELSRTAF